MKPCINENAAGTHGRATHGCRCKACYAVHKGVPVAHVSDVWPLARTRLETTTVTISKRAYELVAASAKARGISLRAAADELIGGGSMSSSPGTERAA